MPSPRNRGGRPTLSEVAARAGVGRGTASRVLNNSTQVSPAVRAAVQEAMEELGYVPNRAARALVTQRTDSVALVISESGERAFGEPFFAEIARGISEGLADTPLQLWLSWVQSPAAHAKMDEQLTDQHVDGVMLISLHDRDPLPALLIQRGLPTVLGGRPARMLEDTDRSPFVDIPFVDVDNVGGGRQAVEHLLAIGRRRIATIAGPQDMGAGLSRLTGYRQAIERGGAQGTEPGGPQGAEHSRAQGPQCSALVVDEGLIDYGDFTAEAGFAAMRRLLGRRPDLDAVFVASDLMAMGAIGALREAGRRIPEDVAVVGFEDSSLAVQCSPPLTSVHQPVAEMGRQMARMLVAQINGETLDPPHVLLSTELVRRQSA